MKKLVAIIGSPRGNRSATYKIADKVSKALKNRGIDISSEFFILSDLEINRCTGCTGCFIQCSSCITFKIVMDANLKNLC